MAKIARYEFLGSWVLFWLMSITVIGIPLAILYLINGTVRVEEDVDDPERLIEQLRKR